MKHSSAHSPCSLHVRNRNSPAPLLLALAIFSPTPRGLPPLSLPFLHHRENLPHESWPTHLLPPIKNAAFSRAITSTSFRSTLTYLVIFISNPLRLHVSSAQITATDSDLSDSASFSETSTMCSAAPFAMQSFLSENRILHAFRVFRNYVSFALFLATFAVKTFSRRPVFRRSARSLPASPARSLPIFSPSIFRIPTSTVHLGQMPRFKILPFVNDLHRIVTPIALDT